MSIEKNVRDKKSQIESTVNCNKIFTLVCIILIDLKMQSVVKKNAIKVPFKSCTSMQNKRKNKRAVE